MLGSCDSRFVFGTVKMTTNKDDNPQTTFLSSLNFLEELV